ncbi:MAG: hypothetical protein V7609_2080 [Verrucomicrobiota bacterium]
MPTVAADLFVDNAGNTLLFNKLGGLPSLPAMNAGDALGLSIYFFDRGSGTSPFKDHRYAGAAVTVRLRAADNNHIYATGNADAEIAPSTGVTITRVQAGVVSGRVAEIQRVQFASVPFTGQFTLTFPGPAHTESGDATIGPKGTTIPISVDATIADVLAAIRALPFRNGRPEQGDQGSSWGQYVTITGTIDNFVITFGGPAAGPLPLTTADVSDVQYKFGYSAVVNLTAVDFTDLFLTANAPAYIEVLLTPSGGSQAYAAQYQLVSSGGGDPGTPPPPIGGGGGGTGGGADPAVSYVDGDFSIAKAVDVVRVEQPFPQTPSALIYRQPYWQLDGYWSPLALDTGCPYNGAAGLVEETQQQSVGGGRIVSWERVWATVPPTRIEYEVINYPYQQVRTIPNSSAVYLLTASFTRRARVTYTYYRTTNAASIPLARLPRAIVADGVANYFDGFFNVVIGNTVIARDDTLRRWMGNIWEKTSAVITL